MSISTESFPLLTLERQPARRREPMRVRPFRSPEVPRPSALKSGLFPAVEWQPEPPRGRALRLRRAVALVVVLGTVSLLSYASWQRVAHGHELSNRASAPAAHGPLGRP
jgi:cytochrome c-type biogenesis protein CcmH/NrfG